MPSILQRNLLFTISLVLYTNPCRCIGWMVLFPFDSKKTSVCMISQCHVPVSGQSALRACLAAPAPVPQGLNTRDGECFHVQVHVRRVCVFMFSMCNFHV